MNQTLNLVFDVSNMMFRSLFTVRSFATKNTKRFSKQEDISNFIIKLCRDISFIIRTYGPNARVLFACDARDPWRQKLAEEIPMGYKGTRDRQDDIDWDNIFSAVNDLKNILRQKGFPVLEVANTEADDIMALLKEKLYYNTDNNSLIFVTSDEDIRQLIDYNKDTKQFVVCLNPISKRNDITGSKIFYINQDIEDYELTNDSKSTQDSVIDLFNPDSFISSSSSLLNDLMSINRTVYEVVDPTDIVLRKIFCGDDGDNIPALYTYYTKNDKLKRITNSIYKKIKEDLSIECTDDLNKYQDSENLELTALDESVKERMKLKELDYVPSTFVKRQRRLVELSPKLFPDNVITVFDSLYNIISSKFDTDYKIIRKSNLRYEDLLEGTKWLSYTEGTPDNAVLSDMNNYFKSGNLSDLFKSDTLF